MSQNRTRAVIYTRASLDATGQRESVTRQEDACRSLAAARGWQVVQVHADNSISGYGVKLRPGWQAVLRMIEAREVEVVIAWHIDRLTRNMGDLESLITLADQRGVGVATASGDIDLTSDVGRMVARILAAVARAEVERKAARRTLANRARAHDGAPPGAGPRAFGYTPRYTSHVPAEAEAIRWGASAALAGTSMRAIAREWTSRGLSTSMGRTRQAEGITGRGVAAILSHPRYAGLRTYDGAIVGPGRWAPILGESEHYALRALLSDPARVLGSHPRRGTTHTTLLGGLLTCAVCEGVMVASAHTSGAKRYKCSRGHVSCPREEIEDFTTAELCDRFALPDALSTLAPSDSEAARTARKDALDARAHLDTLAELLVSGEIDRSQLTAGTTRAREKLRRAEDALAASARFPLAHRLVAAGDVTGFWSTLTLPEQRSIIAGYLSVTVARSTRQARQEWVPEDHVTLTWIGAGD